MNKSLLALSVLLLAAMACGVAASNTGGAIKKSASQTDTGLPVTATLPVMANVTATSTKPAQKTITIIGACNVRPAPGDLSAHISQVADGAVLVVIGTSVDGWQMVQTDDGKTGYVNIKKCKTK